MRTLTRSATASTTATTAASTANARSERPSGINAEEGRRRTQFLRRSGIERRISCGH